MTLETKTPAGGDHAGADENNGENSLHPNDARAQRARILKWLQGGRALSTLDAREHLDVLHPAMRVLELRAKGHNITTQWQRQETVSGRRHRVALYVLRPGAGQVLA